MGINKTTISLLLFFVMCLFQNTIAQECNCNDAEVPKQVIHLLPIIEDSCSNYWNRTEQRSNFDKSWSNDSLEFSVIQCEIQDAKIWNGNIQFNQYLIHVKYGEIEKINSSNLSNQDKNGLSAEYPNLIYCRKIQLNPITKLENEVLILPDTLSRFCNCEGVTGHFPRRTIEKGYSLSYIRNCTYLYSIDYDGNGKSNLVASIDGVRVLIKFEDQKIKSIRYNASSGSFCVYEFNAKGRVKSIKANSSIVKPNRRDLLPMGEFELVKALSYYPPLFYVSLLDSLNFN